MILINGTNLVRSDAAALPVVGRLGGNHLPTHGMMMRGDYRTGCHISREGVRVRVLSSPSRQLLLEGDRPVRLGSCALDILATLVEGAGDFVTKDELIARVWPDVHVEEGNLKVHIAALRRPWVTARPVTAVCGVSMLM